MYGECHKREFSRRDLCRNAGSVGFFASRICIRSQDDKVDSWLGSREFQDLLDIGTHVIPSTRRGHVKAQLESDHTVAAVVGDP
jgi:hypothetical protein